MKAERKEKYIVVDQLDGSITIYQDKIKTFHHFNFIKLRKTFQFELIRLIQEAGGLKKPEEKNRLYKNHPKGFYVYAKFKSTDNDSNDASYNKK